MENKIKKELNSKENKSIKIFSDKEECFIQKESEQIEKNSNNIIQTKKDNKKPSKKIEDTENKKNEQKQDTMKSLKLQEKLKKIFLEREKAKYKYSKQLIPEQFKYNSDEEESTYSIKKQDSIKNNEIKEYEAKANCINEDINTNIHNENSSSDIKINEDIKGKNRENKEEDINRNEEEIEKENNNIKNINIKNEKSSRNNKVADEFREKYYKLLSSKSTDEIELNIKKEKSNKSIQLEKENKNSQKENINKSEPGEIKKNNINIQMNKDSPEESALSRNIEKIEKNNTLKESNSLENTNKNEKIQSNPISFNEKKNVLKILELIKNKKSERELISQKKDEIIKRSKSFAQNRKESGDIKKLNNKESKERKTKKFSHIKTDTNYHENIPSKKIYKKNCKIIRINSKNKKNNYLTEKNNSKIKKEKDEKLVFSPLNISNNENNALSYTNKTNKFVINNRLQNINKKSKNEIDNLRKKTENSFYRTSNQIKPIKKYEKPKISTSTSKNNIFDSTNLSLSKNKILFNNDNNSKSKYKESIIYSPKKMKIKKINSENNFKKKNKLTDNDNYYIKKKSILNENNEFSKSNYNIYDNFSNIHNYYNNSKIYLKNKYISIHPSFSINNNFINNNINEKAINTNNNCFHKFDDSKEIQRKNKKVNIKKLGSGNLYLSNRNQYIYQKNKLNIKNKIIDNCFADKEWYESENTDTGKIDDINYENFRLGTEEMTYNNNYNQIRLKNEVLNLGDSYINLCNDNNTLYQPMENYINVQNLNQIYKNNETKNNVIKKNSPLYQRKLKKINNVNSLNNNNYKRNHRLNNNSILINIENILIFEEKFNIIISYLKEGLSIIKPCLDFWNYYYNSWVYEKFEKIFNDEDDSEIVKMFINYLLLSVMICYSFSLKKEIINNLNYLLLQILEINYNSIMLIFQKIKNSIFLQNQDNIFFPILSKLYIKYMKNTSYKEENDNLMITEKIFNNNEMTDLKIKNLLSRKKGDYFKILFNFYNDIRDKSYREINEFFIKYILEEENINGSLFSSNYYINNNSSFTTVNPPFLKSPNKKNFTLVLDLNETLINFKYEENGEGYVRIRPFLFGFLEEVSQLYELIVFTSSEKEYADSVIEAIERERTYFDHVFYRQHTIIVGNYFVKDLTRIGRPLNSTIIIDNMPQNFKLQKENGIFIKPFWGQDTYDRALYDLIPILLDIAREGGDVRYGLNKYRNEIIGKISSSITKKKYND